jgi:MoaA/NifB/PqqE/SkfB family radical SAM enzyme
MIWSAICFNFNEENLDHMQGMAKDFGFDVFTVVRSSKFGGRYATKGVDLLKPSPAGVAKTAQYEMDSKYFTPVVPFVLKSKEIHPWAKCINWTTQILINVDGLVFPCAWFHSGYMSNPFFEKYKDKLSIKTRTLGEILADPMWNELISSFDANPLPICQMKCKNA